MPLIHCIPITDGITREELEQRISSGWLYIGQMAIRDSSLILDPTKPVLPGGAVPVHVWILPEPMFPAGALVQLFIAAYGQLDRWTLDNLARQLFGRTVPELRSAADPPQEEGEEEVLQ